MQHTTASGGVADYGAFAHLRADNVATYRAVMGAFVAAKRRFTLHLRPADVADLVRRAAPTSGDQGHDPGDDRGDGDADPGGPTVPDADAIAAALGQLCGWGNLRAHPDTGRVTTVEDFHRARFLYQLTDAGEAAERALAAFDDALGRRGALQAVALADIATHLRALLALGVDDVDAASAHLTLDALVGRFTALADNAQAFMGSLQRSIDLHDVDAEAFTAYKGRLVDYLERFVGDLQTTGAEIAVLVAELETRIAALVEAVVAREAADVAPDADGAELAWQVDLLREAWRERWEGVRAWFLSAPGRPSQAKMLRGQARAAVPALLQVVAALNERRQGRSDRSADFRRLAAWFAAAPDDDARHRLWHTAFGLSSARHLSVDADTLAAREADPVAASTPWAQAEPLRISPQLRRTGSWERRGRPSAVLDRSAQRRHLAARLEAESAQTGAARLALVSSGPRLLSQLDADGALEQGAFALFLSLLATALARSRPGGGKVVATTGDGSLAIELQPVDGAGTVSIRTEHGVLSGPDHLLWVRELRPGPAPGPGVAPASATAEPAGREPAPAGGR